MTRRATATGDAVDRAPAPSRGRDGSGRVVALPLVSILLALLVGAS